MNKYVFFLALMLNTIQVQCQDNERYSFDIIKNAETLSSFIDDDFGLIMSFRFWNNNGDFGIGGGWIIHEGGAKQSQTIAVNFYPEERRPGRYFIDDLFHRDSVNPKVDSTMLNDFDIYLYRVDTSYLEKRLNTDGEGAGKTYSYYETYPLNVDLFKRTAGQNFFTKEDTYHANTEDEYLKILQDITKYKKEIARKSND